MHPLPPGEALPPLPPPRQMPDEWTAERTGPAGTQPASPFGVLALRVEPADAQVLVDGEVWVGTGSHHDLVIHMAAGWHELEVRRDGYQTLRTGIELSEGSTTRLNVRLVR
jgi:hypothetical protein